MINNKNQANEYYLTDIVKCYRSENKNKGEKIGLYEMHRSKVNEIININTKHQLIYVNQLLG